MKHPARHIGLLGLLLVLVVLAAMGTAPSRAAPVAESSAGGQRDRVRLQLKWVTQAQFAGFYAAQAQGFYAGERLDVEILPGGPDFFPEEVVAAGRAEFGINWVPSLLASRERGLNLVNIAQLFQRSATTEITWRDSGITSIAQLRGKRVAVWCCGNQYELFAALHKFGIDPDNPGDVTIVDQPFDMDLFLQRQVDAAAATTYNELAQVLETVNPATGRLYTLEDLNVLSMEEAGTGMLQDGIFVHGDWIADARNQDIAVRFLRASFRGWIYCRDHPEACVQTTLANGTALGQGHQRWMMNEVNALIWPSPLGIGLMDPEAFARTVNIALQFQVIARPVVASSHVPVRTDLARAALEGIPEDSRGLGWRKATVEVTPGGR